MIPRRTVPGDVGFIAEKEPCAAWDNYGAMTSESQPTRVLQVVRPAEGGIRRHVGSLCAELPKRGFAVSVAAHEGFSLEMADSPQNFPLAIPASPNPLRDLATAR